MSNGKDDISFFSTQRWPKASAGLIATIVAVPSSGVGISLLLPFLDFQTYTLPILITGLVAGLFGAIAAFLLLAHQFGAAIPTRLLPPAFGAIGMLVALQSGQAATLVAFGEAGPWGDAVKGITGPFTDGVAALRGSVEWWPIPFAIAFTGALMAAGWAWDHARPLYVADDR